VHQSGVARHDRVRLAAMAQPQRVPLLAVPCGRARRAIDLVLERVLAPDADLSDTHHAARPVVIAQQDGGDVLGRDAPLNGLRRTVRCEGLDRACWLTARLDERREIGEDLAHMTSAYERGQ